MKPIALSSEANSTFLGVGNFRNVIVSVSDNGWGIAPKDQKLIFRQFYRVPHENAIKGHGIGLALVKYVVEAHGGKVTVKSEQGEGSIFTFNIPVK